MESKTRASGEACGHDRAVLVERPHYGAGVRGGAVQCPGLPRALQRVVVLAALDGDARDAVGLHGRDALVAPLVRRAVHELRQLAAPQVHPAVAGAAHVGARMLRAATADDEVEERPAAAPDPEPAAGRAVHLEAAER